MQSMSATDSEEVSFESEDDLTIDELRAKLHESRIETGDALRSALKALEERNEYRDMVIELQSLCREALDGQEFWKGIAEKYEKGIDEIVSSNLGETLSHPSYVVQSIILILLIICRVSRSRQLFSNVAFQSQFESNQSL